jgi:parallel beta-helix repeat protein
MTIDLATTVRGTVIYVGGGGSGNYSTIQEGIDVAGDGDTVFVYSGIYYEHVIVNKTVNLIGEDKNTTIIDGDGNGIVIYVKADWVNITGFLINRSGIWSSDAGIKLWYVENCNIIDNKFTNNGGALNLVYSNHSNVLNNVMSDNQFGVWLDHSHGNKIKGNNISNGNLGISFRYSSGNNVTNNIISSNKVEGIRLWDQCNWNNISSNVFLNNEHGITIIYSFQNNVSNNYISLSELNGVGIYSSQNNTVMCNNILSNNEDGIYLYNSTNIAISGNNISSNLEYGIMLEASYLANITCNNFLNDGIFMWGYQLVHFNSHNMQTDNTVNGKPLYYYKDCNGIVIENKPVGQIILANCSETLIKDVQINNTDVGIIAGYCTNTSIIDNNILSNIFEGIYMKYTSGNIISGNILSNNEYGINFDYLSNMSIITNNDILNNDNGIFFYRSYNNSIIQNKISNNKCGIFLSWSTNNSVERNLITNNSNGVYFFSVHLSNVKSNNIYSHEGVGIHFVTSRYNKINTNNITDCWAGIQLWQDSNNNTLLNNKVSNNTHGILVWLRCVNNSILLNNIFNNDNYGIRFRKNSNSNLIYHNNFIANSVQAYEEESINFWDNDYPLGGNFWSDYTGVDILKGPYQNMPGSDGIGDNPYADIDSDTGNQDNYPLMEPYIYKPLENYTILKQGWNLISLPLIQENQSLRKVLEMIDGWYDAVQWYDSTNPNDPWKHHKVGKPFGNDLYELNETMGFWIHITHPGDTFFLYNGTQPTENQIIQLHKGWNLVGYPSLESYNRTDGLNNLTFDNQVDAIWTYDASYQKWIEMGETDYFELGRGYYIHIKTECEWEVPL